MVLYLAGLGVFLATHIFTAFRSRATGQDLRLRMGEGAYMLTYSVVALGAFIAMVYGYRAAGTLPVLYDAPIWGRHLNYVLMPVALVMLAAAYMPTGMIKKTLKHPMLAAVKVWALGHLLANGEFRAVILFAAFLAWAVLARIMAKRRGDIGPGPEVATNVVGDVLSIVVGLGVFAAVLLYLHPILFGVAVWPPV